MGDALGGLGSSDLKEKDYFTEGEIVFLFTNATLF